MARAASRDGEVAVGGAVPPLALRAVLAVAVAKSALNLAFAGRYGWQRDELYYWVAGRHLQGGYVEFPPVTALLAALVRVPFGDSLVGLRAFAVAAGAAVVVVAALVARELGGEMRAQVVAAIVVAFSPMLVGANSLFQPVSFDQLATVAVLWLALRLALGRGSWPLLGLAAGVALETKYTAAVVLALLVATFAILRRDVLSTRGLTLATAIAGLLVIPNLVWQAGHDWASVRWFLDPPASATDESRPEYVVNLLILTGLVSVPVAVAGVVHLARDRRLRPLAWTVVGVVLAYFVLGGKSYYALPAVFFALAAGAVPVARWATGRRLAAGAAAFAVLELVLLPLGVPLLPLQTAIDLGIVDARTDYADELGWPELARTVGRSTGGAEVVVAINYGEAGALELYGRGLPPVASGDVTFRYWRPDVDGTRAVLVGFDRETATFCRGYHVVARIRMPVDNDEQGGEIARCALARPLGAVWPRVVALYD